MNMDRFPLGTQMSSEGFNQNLGNEVAYLKQEMQDKLIEHKVLYPKKWDG